MNSLRLEPISRVAGEVNLPGSKSVSNRALLLAALARGTTRLTNLLDSDDIRHMLAALTQLGVKYKLSADKTECTVQGLGRSFAVKEPVNLFLGNAGTAMRPLCARYASAPVNILWAASRAWKSVPSAIWWMPCVKQVPISST